MQSIKKAILEVSNIIQKIFAFLFWFLPKEGTIPHNLYRLKRNLMIRFRIMKVLTVFPLLIILLTASSIGLVSCSNELNLKGLTDDPFINVKNPYDNNSSISNQTNQSNTDIQNNGTISNSSDSNPSGQGSKIEHNENIKIFDKKSSSELTTFNWGPVRIGVPSYYSITVQNIGEKAITLQLKSSNWSPGIDASLTWNYDGRVIEPGTKVSIRVSLVIISATTSSFYNNIEITSTNH